MAVFANRVRGQQATGSVLHQLQLRGPSLDGQLLLPAYPLEAPLGEPRKLWLHRARQAELAEQDCEVVGGESLTCLSVSMASGSPLSRVALTSTTAKTVTTGIAPVVTWGVMVPYSVDMGSQNVPGNPS